MSMEVQRALAFVAGMVCTACCFRKQFFGASIGGSAGRTVNPWVTRAFLLASAASFFWAALSGIS